MDAELVRIAGQIAGIGGLAIGALLILYRDVIRKNIFPQMTKDQAYRLLRLIIILAWSVAIVGIAAWVIAATFPSVVVKEKPILPSMRTPTPAPTSTVVPTSESSLTPSASTKSPTHIPSTEPRPTKPTRDSQPDNKQNIDEDKFNQLLKDARKLLEVEQYYQACQLYRQAVGILPDSKRGEVSFSSIAEAKTCYDRDDFRTAAKKYAEAFQKVSIQ
jgi:hypothetical protein